MAEVQEKTVDQMTTEELEAYLAEKKQAETEALESQRKLYESERDEVIEIIHQKANEIHDLLTDFKIEVQDLMDYQHEQLDAYGKIRSNSKGGFSITHSDDEKRITRLRSTQPEFDERSEKGIELIKEYLDETMKESQPDTYEAFMILMERNHNGDLEYSKVMKLQQWLAKKTHPKAVEGMRLILEGYSTSLRRYGYEIKRKNKDGKWDVIELNFNTL